jgi:predicted nucleic acid-binding protein
MVNVAYFDTSALLKQYVTETGSNWIRAYLSSATAPAVFTSQLTAVEATGAFARRLRDGTLLPADHATVVRAFDYDITYRYTLLDVMPVTIDTARRLANLHPLRAYDAVQLATAWSLNRDLVSSGEAPLTFICADDSLLTVAQVRSPHLSTRLNNCSACGRRCAPNTPSASGLRKKSSESLQRNKGETQRTGGPMSKSTLTGTAADTFVGGPPYRSGSQVVSGSSG